MTRRKADPLRRAGNEKDTLIQPDVHEFPPCPVGPDMSVHWAERFSDPPADLERSIHILQMEYLSHWQNAEAAGSRESVWVAACAAFSKTAKYYCPNGCLRVGEAGASGDRGTRRGYRRREQRHLHERRHPHGPCDGNGRQHSPAGPLSRGHSRQSPRRPCRRREHRSWPCRVH